MKNPSNEQKRYVAAVCPEFESYVALAMRDSSVENEVSCDECIHWDDGRCDIFDDILTSIDQT
ncbi:MAG: hypothetical protein GX974_05110 [Clostridiales bacterium]|nr:hypothetical protein [Clostridiales bacterium]